MSNGTFELKSEVITGLYHEIVSHNPVNEHWTLSRGYFAAVITKAGKKSILIYNFPRSIKPLARVVEGGAVVVMRDYFTEKEMVDYMTELSLLTLMTAPLMSQNHAHHTHVGNGMPRHRTQGEQEPCLSDVLDKTNAIARDLGIPVPPRKQRQ